MSNERVLKFRTPFKCAKGHLIFDAFEIRNGFIVRVEPIKPPVCRDDLWGAEPIGQSQQFTGLLDRNGKEIYEGDIITGSWRHDNDDLFPFEKAEVLYNAEHASFTVPCTYDKYVKHPIGNYRNFLWQCERIKVIGNIHENPELIPAS